MADLDLEVLRRLQRAIEQGMPLALIPAGLGNAAITQLPAIIAALERAQRVEAAVVKVERRLRNNGFLTYADPLRAALEGMS